MEFFIFILPVLAVIWLVVSIVKFCKTKKENAIIGNLIFKLPKTFLFLTEQVPCIQFFLLLLLQHILKIRFALTVKNLQKKAKSR